MKSIKKRSLKTRRERNKCRVNRLRKQGAMFGLMSNPVMILVAITYNFGALTNPEKVLARMHLHIFMMTGNLHFPLPNPTLADMQTKADQLMNLISQSATGDRLIIEQRNIVEQEALDMIRRLGYYVQQQSNGDAEIIHSAGFTTRKPRTPLVKPGQALVERIIALHEAKVELNWPGLTLEKVMLIEVSIAPGDGIWYFAGISDVTSITLEGFQAGNEYHFFQPGSKYYFRIRGWNHVDFGDYSETVDAFCIE